MSAAVRRTPRPARLQRGMGLIELMVTIVLSMFMMAGLLSIVYGSRQNYTAQNQLAQLQDSERLALTIVANSVEQAGYFYNPGTQPASFALPRSTVSDASGNSATFAYAGQSIYGTGANANADTLWVRYVSGPSDTVLDCQGQSNSSGAAQTDVNYLYLSGNVLYCETFWNGTSQGVQPLVSGVSAMNILYGVASAAFPYSASEYMTATEVTSGDLWRSVVSVKVTLKFVPNAIVSYNGSNGANQFSSASYQVSRIIDLLNRV